MKASATSGMTGAPAAANVPPANCVPRDMLGSGAPEGGLGAMTYSVKELYYTLQGEGAQSGRAAVFLRFAGCNLWSGLEKDRSDAVCRFCDTDFVGTDGPGGGKFTSASSLARAVFAQWPESAKGKPY